MSEDGAPRVLVAEDDRSVRESLLRALRMEGYDVTAVTDGEQALAAVESDPPDLLVLDIMMPNVDGLTVCRRLRARQVTMPILMLTARHEVSDRVTGLDAGADDYLVKPFALDELSARMRALLRRTSVSGSDDVVRVGDLVLDPLGRTAAARRPPARPHEDRVRRARAADGERGHRPVTARRIYERIWGYDFETSSRSLDVYIGYLRTKTEAGGEPRLVHTVRGVGYLIRKP